MFPLTNTQILAPLLVGYMLERLALDSLALQYETIVTESHQKGMSEAQVIQKLHTLTRSRNTRVTTLQSTSVYEEPPEAAHAVATWVRAESTPAGRDQVLGVGRLVFLLLDISANGRFQIRPAPRVPETLFIPPPGPWPKVEVKVRIQNHGETIIFYQFPKDGKLEAKYVENGHVKDEIFLANNNYMFVLKTRETQRHTK